MSLSNIAEDAILDLILNNVTWANIGDATGLVGSTVDGNLYLSLHNADPGEAADQSSSEVSYTSYARVAVTRAGTGWTVSAGATLASTASFPECTGGSDTATYGMVGSASSGTGIAIASGALSNSISISTGVTPQITDSTTFTLD